MYARTLRHAPEVLERTASSLEKIDRDTNAKAHELEQNESYPLLARALRVRKEHIACRAAAATLKGVRLCCDAALANDGGPLFDAGRRRAGGASTEVRGRCGRCPEGARDLPAL